jgi:hypothetical protein
MACSSVDFPKYDDHGQKSWSLSPVPKAVQFGGMWRLLSDIWIKLKQALWGLRAAKLQVRIYEPCLLLLPSFDHITCIPSKPFKNADGRKMVCSSTGCHKIRSGSHVFLLARGQFRKPSSWPHMWYLLSPYQRASRATLMESSKSSTASSARLWVYKPHLLLCPSCSHITSIFPKSSKTIAMQHMVCFSAAVWKQCPSLPMFPGLT